MIVRSEEWVRQEAAQITYLRTFLGITYVGNSNELDADENLNSTINIHFSILLWYYYISSNIIRDIKDQVLDTMETANVQNTTDYLQNGTRNKKHAM